ncbi:hypothetical protein BM525_19475 (plasmid) [Alteromonas mediterranea]|uniref:Uncharacterized protein n=1 Tax=Alteromonas mediterranea TaxID=314275 RepID=A0AAC9JE61_9ALTE|nr:hypothetical protein [Alteromonas mediterranea]APD92065.1 hypothetical protein BM524_19280 [Alteromonas mediterranea]APD99919.1 hypothetical protein BM525_19475 [Alteromonas mediterranea]
MYTGFTICFSSHSAQCVSDHVRNVLEASYRASITNTENGFVAASLHGESTTDYEVCLSTDGNYCTIDGWGNASALIGSDFINKLQGVTCFIRLITLTGCWLEDDEDSDELSPTRHTMKAPLSWGLIGDLNFPPTA